VTGSSSAPEVSVLLPVRDGAATLGRAIASIRAQSLAAWELLIVDDGSRDASRSIAHAHAAEDTRVRVIERDRGGIVAALNAGLAVARGEFIARMDADDEALPHRLAAQLDFLRGHDGRELGLVGCGVEFAGDRVTGAGYALHVDWVNSLCTPAAIALNRFVESPFAHPSVMFRRQLVSQHGGYRDGDFPEDYELWLRWLDAGVPMAKLPETLLRWSDPPSRLSRTDPRYDPDAFFRAKAPWIARWILARPDLARRPVWVWGAGRPTRKRAAALQQHGLTLAGYIDVDAKKRTPALGGTGLPVILPATLPARGEIFVLGYVTSRGAREQIRAELTGRGYVEGEDFLMCA
jgi:glycosyltransferase involved in cell wall biosynthesis